jgi:hypothetical protein
MSFELLEQLTPCSLMKRLEIFKRHLVTWYFQLRLSDSFDYSDQIENKHFTPTS